MSQASFRVNGDCVTKVGGAVVGGMLGGPIGAVVGAQVASKMGPALDSALQALEGDLEEEEEKKDEEKKEEPEQAPAKKAVQAESKASPSQPGTAAKVSDKAPMPAEDVSEAQSSASAPAGKAGAPADMPSPSARGDDLMDELQALRKGVPEKEKKLEAEIAELYAKAKEAMKVGDEEAARKLLESKAQAQASLESLRAGQQRRAAQQSEQLESLEFQVKDLYARAEKSLIAGNETEARRCLQEREQALEKLAQLQRARES
ncbi:TKL-1 [Symbiodinium sp. CCMP2592]|nr:TKL-1 [Symbiodinium sp. CCMP2592]